MSTSWQNQTPDAPLFPDLIWSRPERADQAGKLLIIGGSSHGFANVVHATELAKKSGIGEVKVLLPKSIEKYLGHSDKLLYAAATAAGSFSKSAIAEAKGYIDWADGVFLPGDLTHNAETSMLVESIINLSDKPVVIAGEAVDLMLGNKLMQRQGGLIAVLGFRQLQQMVKTEQLDSALLTQSTLEQRISLAQALISKTSYRIIVLADEGSYVVVSEDSASLTTAPKPILEFSAAAAVLSAQFQDKLFAAVTTAAILN